MQKRGDGVGGELCAMKCRLCKAPECRGKRFSSDGAGFCQCSAVKLHGEERSASDGSSATATKKASFRDAARFEARGELEDVAANRVRNFDDCGGAGQLTGVTRVLEMIENGFAKHFFCYES